jgi:hypothetical protein
MSSTKKPSIDPKSTITVADYLAIEKLVRERPSVSSLEKSVQLFPSCAIFWVTYLDFLSETPEKALKVAERAVNHCPHIDLWKRYLSLAKFSSRLPEYYPIYDKAINAVGNDPKSSDFWIEALYIQRALFNTHLLISNDCLENPTALPSHFFLLPLSAQPPKDLSEDVLDVEALKIILDNASIPKPSISSIRDVFHSALSVPMEKLDTVYDEYQSFEQVVATALVAMAQNAPTIGGMPPPQMMAGVQASKYLSEYSTRWIQSKNGLKEIQRVYADVNFYFAPIPLSSQAAQTVQGNILAWRRVLKFEKTNPFKLSYKKFKARLNHVFSLCMMSNVYVSEFWIDKVVWLLADAGIEPALVVLETAIKEYLAHDVLLRLVKAYLLEESGQIGKALEWYTESLAHYSAVKKPVPSLLMHQVRFACRSISTIHARNIFLQHVAAKSIHIQDWKIFAAFAKLELYTMKNPPGALKVLQFARNFFPEKAKENLEAVVAEIESFCGERKPIQHPPVLSLGLEEAKNLLRFGNIGFENEVVADDQEVVDLEESNDVEGGIKRPDPARMMAYKPGMESNEEERGTSNSIEGVLNRLITHPLKSLSKLLPDCTSSSVPDTDIVLKTLQTIVLPEVSIGGLRQRLEEDPAIEQLRREREEVKGQQANLKRLLVAGDEKRDDDDVIIKSDLLDEEREQREFLSALASNIHRERVYYKRHKIIAMM